MSDLTINTEGLTAHPSRAAAWMPVVAGICPACNTRSLFLAVGGHVTCAIIGCTDPCAAADALRDYSQDQGTRGVSGKGPVKDDE